MTSDVTRLPEHITRLAELDACATATGITVESARAGEAVLSLVVRSDMLNGHGICHGGITFLLADTALAYAANSEGRGAVTTSSTINYLSPGKHGDVLTARAHAVEQARRSGIYDVEVSNQEGVVVAVFRGSTVVVRGYSER